MLIIKCSVQFEWEDNGYNIHKFQVSGSKRPTKMPWCHCDNGGNSERDRRRAFVYCWTALSIPGIISYSFDNEWACSKHNSNDNDSGFPVPVPIWGEHSWLTMPHSMFCKNKLIYNLHINNSNAGGKKYIPHDLRDNALGKMTFWIPANLEYNIKIGNGETGCKSYKWIGLSGVEHSTPLSQRYLLIYLGG